MKLQLLYPDGGPICLLPLECITYVHCFMQSAPLMVCGFAPFHESSSIENVRERAESENKI